jgi:hypothetical protein
MASTGEGGRMVIESTEPAVNSTRPRAATALTQGVAEEWPRFCGPARAAAGRWRGFRRLVAMGVYRPERCGNCD